MRPDPGAYIAPLRFHFLTRFYDVLVRWMTRERVFKDALLAQLGGARVRIDLEQAFADRMPFPSGSFDAAVSSLFFHHLTYDAKRNALAEILRVLKPGGSLHVADWGRPTNLLLRAAFLLVQALDGLETTRDSVAGVLPEMMSQAGFVNVRHTRDFATALGTMALYSAAKPPLGKT